VAVLAWNNLRRRRGGGMRIAKLIITMSRMGNQLVRSEQFTIMTTTTTSPHQPLTSASKALLFASPPPA